MSIKNAKSLVLIKNAQLISVAEIIKVTEKILLKNRSLLVPYLKKSGKYIYLESESLNPVFENKEFSNAELFIEDFAAVNLNGAWGFIDRTGFFIVPMKYIDVKSFSEGLAMVHYMYYDDPTRWEEMIEQGLGGVKGFVDGSGNEIIPMKYRSAFSFSEGLAAVNFKGKWGFINTKGNEMVPMIYDEVESFNEGLAKVCFINMPIYKKNDFSYDPFFFPLLSGFIDKNGVEIIPIKYDDSQNFSDGLAGVKLNNKWGYIDKTGVEIVPMKYCGAGKFSEGFAPVALNVKDKVGFISKSGFEIVPLNYNDAQPFSEGFAAVNCKGSWGFIYIHGGSIPMKYSNVHSFSEGLAGVNINGKWGFIDKYGKQVVSIKYDEVERFRGGFAKVTQNGYTFFISKSGREYREQ